MRHPDEFTLELYVTGSKRIAQQRRSIGRHLTRCPDCSRRAEAIREFYADVSRGMVTAAAQAMESGEEIMARHPEPQKRYEPMSVAVPSDRAVLLRPLLWYFRRHPAVASVGAISILGLFVWAGIAAMGLFNKDVRPAYVHYDVTGRTIEVLNAHDQQIWHKPAIRLDGVVTSEESHGSKFTFLADLENNGTKKLITLVPLSGVDDAGAGRMKIFSDRGVLLTSPTLGRPVDFGNQRFLGDYGGSGLLVWNDSTEHAVEILANAVNFRSPSVLTRFDSRGNWIGEYWHFGHLLGLFQIHLTVPGHARSLLLTGINDSQDSIGITFPVVVVLDPSRIEGVAQSSATPGFGFAQTTTELFYIRLPEPDVYGAEGGKSSVRTLKASSGQSMSFLVQQADSVPGIEFIFTRDMLLTDVKPTDGFAQLRSKLLDTGQLTGRLNDEYLKRLKEGVLYWDGHGWKKEPVRVQGTARTK
jgi:hypothetical protein